MTVALLALYIFSSINGALYYTWLWQLKEYRLDRMIDSISMRTGIQNLFPSFQIIKIFILLIGAAHFLLVKQSDIFSFYVLTALSLEVVDFIFRIMNGQVHLPEKTKKAMAILWGTVLMMVGAGALTIMFSQSIGQFFLIMFILSIVVGDVNSITVFIFHPISQHMKAKIILKARRKLSAHKHLKVIGITGSYGKSSTKEFLSQILKEKYKIFKTPGNTNIDIGIAQVILNELKEEHEILIIEMGAYKKGEIKKTCNMVSPDIGIVTAVAGQHLALFKTLENIQDAKYELIESLPEDGMAFFNIDSLGTRSLVERAKKEGKKMSTYSANGAAKLMALHIQVEKKEITFDIHGVEFNAPVYGRQNLPNLLAAIGAARECGMSFPEISKAVKTIKVPEKIMNLKESKSKGENILAIDDSYNANPDGVMAALEYLDMFEGYKRIVVFPGMLELGPKTEEEHVRVGRKISEVSDFTIFTCADFMEPLKAGLGKNYNEKKYVVSNSEQETWAAIESQLGEKTVVLFEQRGSQFAMDQLLK